MSLTFSDRYFIYRTGIAAPGQASDRPVRNAGGSKRIGVLVHNPGSLALTVRKQTVIQPIGQLNEIPISGVNLTVTTNISHTMRVGDSVTITKSNCVPSIDGTYLVSAVPTEKSFSIVVAAPVTSKGIYAEFAGPTRLFSAVVLTGVNSSQELIVDHTGGDFILELVAPAGPWPVASAVDIYWRAI